ncbi:MAG: AAA family ATPase [Bacteroidota bacterium]
MAYTLSIPFFAFRLRLNSGGYLTSPLSDAQALRFHQSVDRIATQYAAELQGQLYKEGHLAQLMDEYHDGDFYRDRLSVDFPAANDGISHPDFELEFDYYFNRRDNGFWGIIPILGLEYFAPSFAALTMGLRESIRLEFTRKRRLFSMHRLIESIWLEVVELQQWNMRISPPTLKEQEEKEEGTKERWLPRVAQQLKVKRRVVYGREQEMEQLVNALKGQFNRNVVLVGASGVGKTAMVWELARIKKRQKIQAEIWETTASTLIKELTTDTGWQDNLSFLCRELSQEKDFLFVHNFLELFEIGQYVGNELSVAEYLRPFISRGELNLLTECTEEELARIELRSPNFLSYFQLIRLAEPPNLEEVILKKIADLAQVRQLKIAPEAVRETLRLNRRFTPYSGMPGKPIRFLESILVNYKSPAAATKPRTAARITRSAIVQSFCEETGMPAFMVDPDIPMDPKEVNRFFKERLFGQDLAIENVVNLLASVKTALTRTGKPIASFLFVGPTGVGKTEMAKLLSEFMFNSQDRMIRFDMSEYADPYSVLRLTGESYFQDGLLTSAVRREPFCVLLFDEIEKAYPSFYDLLLQMLSEGRLTDSRGQLVNFCSSIIIMTSNIGASNLQNNRISIGQKDRTADVNEHFMGAVRKHFRPELFNRIDQVIPFAPLGKEVVRFVIDREIELFRKREGVQFRNMDLDLEEAALDYLAETGHDPRYGARQLQRSIRHQLIVPLANKLNLYDYEDKVIVKVRVQQEQLEIDISTDPLGLDLLLEELDKINFADHSSELRRQAHSLRECNLYIRLLSRLDILEMEKQEDEKAFWKNPVKAGEYSFGLQLKVDIDALIKEMEQYEEDLALACMSMAPYRPNIIDQLKDWEQRFFQLKVEMYARLNPESNLCYLAIYGTQFQRQVDFYLRLFDEMGFDFQAETIWYREAYYNEKIIVQQEVLYENGQVTVVSQRKKREAYILAPWERHGLAFKAPKKGDLLYGIVFQINGHGAHLYLEGESGLQKWYVSEENQATFMVQVEDKQISPPYNINRKEFYKGNPRRIFSPTNLKDSRMKIDREVSSPEQFAMLKAQLDEQFKLKLNTNILR